MSIHRYNARRDASEPAIVEYLQARGALVERVSARALPDLLVGWCGRWILLEVKTGDAGLKPSQADFHSRALAKGLPVYVVNNIDRVGEMLDRIVRLTRGRD